MELVGNRQRVLSPDRNEVVKYNKYKNNCYINDIDQYWRKAVKEAGDGGQNTIRFFHQLL